MCTVNDCTEEKVNGGKCRKHYNEYMKNYVRNRYIRLRDEWIERLGGRCETCGSKDNLEFDHQDPDKKEFSIARILSTHSKRKVEYEMTKCQLLCKSCHLEKSIAEGSVEHGGGLSGKKNCPCDLCKAKKSQYMQEWYSKNRV